VFDFAGCDGKQAASNGLPEGWKKFYDDKTGKYYYHNQRENKTQWEVPISRVV